MFDQVVDADSRGGRLLVLYQPIYSLWSSTVVSVEALVRWQLPSASLLGAGRVLAAARTPADRLALDLAVLRRGCADMVQLLAEHGNTGLQAVNVNVTASTLTYPGLDRVVREVLDETGLAPQHLHLEIPETAATEDLAEAVASLRALTEAGVSVTLDDVGVEALGLRHARKLAATGVKIDRVLTERMLRPGGDHAVSRLMIDLCAGLDIRLTAEGVETCSQVRTASALGVQAVQGYHLSYPMLPQDLAGPLHGGVRRTCQACLHPQGQRAAVPS